MGKRWQLLEEQRGHTQEPTIPGFIDMASVEAASSRQAAHSGLDASVSTDPRQNGAQSPSALSTASSLSSSSPSSSTTTNPSPVSVVTTSAQAQSVMTSYPMQGVSFAVDRGSPMAVGSGLENSGLFGEVCNGYGSPTGSSSTSGISSGPPFSPEGNSNSPFSTNSGDSEFNTTISLDESTFDLGEDTLQWLEENLLKSIQEQAEMQQQQQQSQQQQPQHSISQPIPITSVHNHVTISTLSHPSHHQHQHPVAPLQPAPAPAPSPPARPTLARPAVTATRPSPRITTTARSRGIGCAAPPDTAATRAHPWTSRCSTTGRTRPNGKRHPTLRVRLY